MLKILAVAAIALPALAVPAFADDDGWFGEDDSHGEWFGDDGDRRGWGDDDDRRGDWRGDGDRYGGQCGVGAGPWLTLDAVIASVSDSGYVIYDVKVEHGCYRVWGTDADGARVRLLIDPVSGDVLHVARGY